MSSLSSTVVSCRCARRSGAGRLVRIAVDPAQMAAVGKLRPVAATVSRGSAPGSEPRGEPVRLALNLIALLHLPAGSRRRSIVGVAGRSSPQHRLIPHGTQQSGGPAAVALREICWWEVRVRPEAWRCSAKSAELQVRQRCRAAGQKLVCHLIETCRNFASSVWLRRYITNSVDRRRLALVRSVSSNTARLRSEKARLDLLRGVDVDAAKPEHVVHPAGHLR